MPTMQLGDVMRSIKRAFALTKKETDTTIHTDNKTAGKMTVKQRFTAASSSAKASVCAASSKALSHGKTWVGKLACHRKPAVKDSDMDSTNTNETNTTGKQIKARRSAVNKAPLMIAARGEDEQLVVPDAQVVVPTYDGPTEAPLPPPSTLFANATTMDRLAREEAMRRAQEETVA